MATRSAAQGAAGLPAAVHGGDLNEVSRDYGISSDRLIDFSASINPAGPPVRALARLAREAADPDLLTRYPDPHYLELRKALAITLKVSASSVTIANGAAALIAAVVRAVKPHACVLATPAFAEYVRALEASGCRTRLFALRAANGFALDVDALTSVLRRYRPRLCVLTNPHNPSGALTSKSELLRVLECARRTKTVLVVDEAFIDYAPTDTLSAETQTRPHLVVVRSVTKFYGMPALRVGYALSSPGLATRIAAQLPPWSVTTLAANAATEAVQDDDYTLHTRAWIVDERRRLQRALETMAVTVYPSAANFLLLRLPPDAPTSAQVRARVISDHGVVVRDCRSFRGLSNGRFIRVAVRRRAENERLVSALASVLEDVRHDRH